MKTLKLFNAVLAQASSEKPHVSEDGYVIEPAALWAKDKIVRYYKKEALNGNDLNKTFHKSWQKIKDSTRAELAFEQILHYLSTYGTNFQGEIYIPDEVVDVPGIKVVFKVVRAYTKKQLTEKCLGMLKSGMALKEETVDDLLETLVGELGYKFTGKEGVKNKEAVVKIADLYGVIPDDFMGFFRYVIFRTTNSTLVIKNPATVKAIKESKYNPTVQFQKFGLERMAEHFNRFKPLFLAFKPKCPKVINLISKLSKTKHKPLVQNPLNLVTQRKLTAKDTHWLDNATPYALLKALSAVFHRAFGQTAFVYKIRNGKSYAKESVGGPVNRVNYNYLLKYLKGRLSLKGLKLFIPEDVVYATPTSEKMYVGNIPMGTKFYGDKLAVGIYWKNSWGAHDLDLSGQCLSGKVGWDAEYGRGGSDGDGLMFSGDIVDAPDGAVEYLYAQKGLPGPTLVLNNVFSGEDECGFKIIVGRGDGIDKDYMMNPNNLFVEVKVQSVQKQSIIGMLIPEGKRQSFVLMNIGSGQVRVSGRSEHDTVARVALTQEWGMPLSLNELVVEFGAKLVKDREDADIDLSLDSLERDTFIKLFESPKPKAKKKAVKKKAPKRKRKAVLA